MSEYETFSAIIWHMLYSVRVTQSALKHARQFFHRFSMRDRDQQQMFADTRCRVDPRTKVTDAAPTLYIILHDY